jgi:hypothetical protein
MCYYDGRLVPPQLAPALYSLLTVFHALPLARRITTQFVAVHADPRSPLPVSVIFSEVGRCIE